MYKLSFHYTIKYLGLYLGFLLAIVRPFCSNGLLICVRLVSLDSLADGKEVCGSLRHPADQAGQIQGPQLIIEEGFRCPSLLRGKSPEAPALHTE